MNDAQKVAFENPCRFAFETAQPQFGWALLQPGASLVLTINSGYE